MAKRHRLAFRWTWLNRRLRTSHIKDAISDSLRKNGFTNELLQEVFTGFWFAVMEPAQCWGQNQVFVKLLKDEISDIVLWHCLNHRLELVVGNALDATSGTNDLQSFLESL